MRLDDGTRGSGLVARKRLDTFYRMRFSRFNYEPRATSYEIMTKHSRIILILLLFLTEATARAAWYQVEVIVFEQLRPDLGGEVWFENPGLPSRADSINLITDIPDAAKGVKAGQGERLPDNSGLIPYMALPGGALRLQRDERILKLSADYRPLLHIAWQQPGYDKEDGRAVHLEQLVEAENPEDTLPPELAEIQIKEDGYVPPEPLIDGTIRLRTTRFLHVDVDIAYFPEKFLQILRSQRQSAVNPQQLVVNRNADYVRLTETRKIKLNELHYFDHPLFGVLLQVSRLNHQE